MTPAPASALLRSAAGRISRTLERGWPCVLLCVLGCVALLASVLLGKRGGYPHSLVWISLALVGLGFGAQAAVVIWRLCHRRWLAALGQFGSTTALLAATFFGVGVIFWSGFGIAFHDSPDPFARDLVVPAGTEEPESGRGFFGSELGGRDADAFQAAMFAALARPGSDDPTVTADPRALAILAREHPELLRRHLAASPAWRLHEERGHVFATRRWKLDGRWQYTLHGYYSSFFGDSEDQPRFQVRVTLGLDGRAWWRGDRDSTALQPGRPAKLHVGSDNQLRQSHCTIELGAVLVEIFEQSSAPERRLTKAALAFLETEFAALLAQTAAADTAASGPTIEPDTITRGEASLRLASSFQPGIYDVFIRANPGESGRVYLRAYEATRGTRLSADRLKSSTNEWIGWSADPDEQFLSNTHFTIYEGDWGQPYAARFEVWFEPGPGGSERKLLERTFRIEGWQR
jgi:hypothetical protein